MTDEERFKTLLSRVNESSRSAAQIAGVFLSTSLILLLTINGVSDRDLLLEAAFEFQMLAIRIDVRRFFQFGPLAYLFLFYVALIHHVLLVQKLIHLGEEVERRGEADPLREQLPYMISGYPITSLIAGTEKTWILRSAMQIVPICTVVVVPLFLLLTFQIRFLPYHDEAITNLQQWYILVAFATLVVAGSFLATREQNSFKVAIRGVLKAAPITSTMTLLLWLCGWAFSWFVALVPCSNWERTLQSALGHGDFCVPRNKDVGQGLAGSVDTGQDWWVPTKSYRPLGLTRYFLDSRFYGADDQLIDDGIDRVRGEPKSNIPFLRMSRNLVILSQDLNRYNHMSNWSRLPEWSVGPASGKAARQGDAAPNDGTSSKWQGTPRLNLSRRNLQFATIEWSNLEQAELIGSDLSGASLEGSSLQHADLGCTEVGSGTSQPPLPAPAAHASGPTQGCVLASGLRANRATLRNVRMAGADLRGVELRNADMTGTDMARVLVNENTNLSGAAGDGLAGVDFSKMPLAYWPRTIIQSKPIGSLPRERLDNRVLSLSDFSLLNDRAVGALAPIRQGRSMQHIHLEGAVGLARLDLRDVDFTGAWLIGADLSGAELREANLTDAKLQGANLRSAKFQHANLTGADLRYADLRGTNLIGANLSNARLDGALLDSDTDLRGAYLAGTSLIGIDMADVRIAASSWIKTSVRPASEPPLSSMHWLAQPATVQEPLAQLDEVIAGSIESIKKSLATLATVGVSTTLTPEQERTLREGLDRALRPMFDAGQRRVALLGADKQFWRTPRTPTQGQLLNTVCAGGDDRDLKDIAEALKRQAEAAVARTMEFFPGIDPNAYPGVQSKAC